MSKKGLHVAPKALQNSLLPPPPIKKVKKKKRTKADSILFELNREVDFLTQC